MKKLRELPKAPKTIVVDFAAQRALLDKLRFTFIECGTCHLVFAWPFHLDPPEICPDDGCESVASSEGMGLCVEHTIDAVSFCEACGNGGGRLVEYKAKPVESEIWELCGACRGTGLLLARG